MTECKEIFPKAGSIMKPGFQCDLPNDNMMVSHEGNHQETFGEGNISMTLEWVKE